MEGQDSESVGSRRYNFQNLFREGDQLKNRYDNKTCPEPPSFDLFPESYKSKDEKGDN